MKTKIVLALLAGSALLAACKGSGSYQNMAADTAARVSDDSVKLVKTADMRIKVKNVVAAAEKISKLTIDAGGLVTHHDLKSNVIGQDNIILGNDSVKKITIYNTTADITIKIPAMLTEVFMDTLNHISTYVDARKTDVEDRSLDYLAQKMKGENRVQSVKLRRNIKLTQTGADSILTLKDDAVDRKVSNLRTEDAAKFTTITLSLYQNNAVSKEILPSTELSDYKSPLSARVGIALSQGWYFFSQLMVGLLNLWPFLLLGSAVWYGIIWYKRKKKTAA